VFLLFFLLHQWRLYFFVVSTSDVLETALILGLIHIGVFFAAKLIVRKSWKAAFVTFIATFLLLYINPVLSFLKLWNIASDLGFQSLIAIVFSGISIFIIKKVGRPFHKFLNFLTITLVILVFLEVILILLQTSRSPSIVSFDTQLKASKGLKLPSVYVIVFDEYAGSESLKENFSYDNSTHIRSLQDRGFNIVRGAVSNYRHTVLSVPSTFNCNYISTPSGLVPHGEDVFEMGLDEMFNNHTFKVFKKLGYQTFNFSPFEINKNPASYKTSFLPQGSLLMLHTSLIAKLWVSLPSKLAIWSKKKEWIESFYYNKAVEQNRLVDEMLSTTKFHKSQPVFCYLHLMLPHSPYLYDSTGKINTAYLSKTKPSVAEQKAAYIQSLSYANKEMLYIFDMLRKETNREAVIIMMSDHGYKSIPFGKNNLTQFNCFNAVYWPGNESGLWYDGMSNVNQFRILINAITESNIPLLKDSIIQN
jgi:hypothetical protein